MEGHQPTVEPLAGGQQLLTAGQHLDCLPLCQPDLQLDHFHHGAAEGKVAHGGKTMLPEDLGHGIGAAKQGVVIGLDALQQVEQNGIVPLEEGGTAGLETNGSPACPQRESRRARKSQQRAMFSCPREAARHPGPFQQQDRPLKMSLLERCLGIHHQLGPLPVALGDLIIMGHTLVHLGQLLAQLPGAR